MATIPETHADLLNVDVASLATLSPQGYPQVTALWFLYEDGEVKISLNRARQKTKNLQARPECTFFVIDPKNPYRTLEIRAKAEIQDDSDYAFADRVGKKYGGADLRKMDKPGQSRVMVVLKPVKVNING